MGAEMTRSIHLGISTCPNDTFAFDAILRRKVDWRGLDFRVELLDIQTLNDRLFAGDFDVAKTSFHAAMMLTGETLVLPSGSALGFGVGPLLLSTRPEARPTGEHHITLCPGEQTTATLLFRIFYPKASRIRQVLFSDIMPGMLRGEADFGVCIHEGRFTWQEQGLHLVEDLGTRWEAETGHPLPLGGLIARRSLPCPILATVQRVIHESLLHAISDPQGALPTMRQYAQEFDDEVLMKHVDLYVNDWTVDLGPLGSAALEELSSRGRRAGLISETVGPMEVFRPE